jgi:predicted metalloprotease with PDZ domain
VHRAANEPEFFANYVDGVDPLPYANVLANAGIEFRSQRRASTLGLKLKSDGVVDAVAAESTGASAGLLPGDELIAIDGLRVQTQAELQHALREEKGEIEILFARGGALETRRVARLDDGAVHIELHVAEEDNALRREWLGRRG